MHQPKGTCFSVSSVPTSQMCLPLLFGPWVFSTPTVAYLSICLPVHLSTCLFNCLYVVYLPPCLSVCLHAWLPAYLSVYLSVCMQYLCLPVSLPACLSTCLSLYPTAPFLRLLTACNSKTSVRSAHASEGRICAPVGYVAAGPGSEDIGRRERKGKYSPKIFSCLSTPLERNSNTSPVSLLHAEHHEECGGAVHVKMKWNYFHCHYMYKEKTCTKYNEMDFFFVVTVKALGCLFWGS